MNHKKQTKDSYACKVATIQPMCRNNLPMPCGYPELQVGFKSRTTIRYRLTHRASMVISAPKEYC
jgi:hypothetical protein